MSFLFCLIPLGLAALFELLFPEANTKMCHVLYRFFMGGEDFE